MPTTRCGSRRTDARSSSRTATTRRSTCSRPNEVPERLSLRAARARLCAVLRCRALLRRRRLGCNEHGLCVERLDELRRKLDAVILLEAREVRFERLLRFEKRERFVEVLLDDE